jgi:PhnB protein
MIFAGCEKAMDFYARAFGAREVMRMKAPDGRLSHAEMRIGDSHIMMADEHPEIEAFAVKHFGGSPVTLMLYTGECDAMYKQALAAGAESLREPADQPYGIRMCGVRDPFGYKWWIGTQIEAMSPDEMTQATLATHGTV